MHIVRHVQMRINHHRICLLRRRGEGWVASIFIKMYGLMCLVDEVCARAGEQKQNHGIILTMVNR